MGGCIICGRPCPRLRETPYQFWLLCSLSRDLNDYPDILWSICPTHCEAFGRYHARMRLKREVKMPTEQDVSAWIQHLIASMVKRMNKGLPLGFCSVVECGALAAQEIDGRKYCNRHANKIGEGKVFVVGDVATDPLSELVRQRLTSMGGE